VAIITSPSGAVIRDFLSIVNRRHSGLNVILIPAAVQGDRAAAEVESAIAQANSSGLADLIVLARGGGSLEDLAAFNSERVARAIAASELPVVSAIGHETDFTIADFAADLRAPTPSAAAELITEAQHKVEEQVAALGNRLVRAARFQLLQARQRLGKTPIAYAQQRIATHLRRLEQRLDDLSFRMETAISVRIREHHRNIGNLTAAVLRHDPRRQLSTARESLTASQGRLAHALERTLAAARSQSQSAEARLYRAAQVSVAARRAAHAELRRELTALSPLAVLSRGYALVQDEQGTIVRSVDQLTENQQVGTRLSNGAFTSQILAIQKKNTPKKDKSTSK
jgi:exodeoxyribonuclease VII large subunit